jgi:hypothetical protein
MKKNVIKLLDEIMNGFDERIAKLKTNKRKVCEVAGLHTNTFYNMKNPNISTLHSINEALNKMEAKK